MSIQFNNGFVTAIALFLEHRDNFFGMSRDQCIDIGLSDNRMYIGSDHLYDMEIPITLPAKLRQRIYRWRKKCFDNRLLGISNGHNQYKVNDGLFKEAEDILAQIDVTVFKTKRVKMRFR